MASVSETVVTIPGVLLKFLERASIAYAATRDRDLLPALHWVSGWAATPDGQQLEVFVSRPYDASLLRNVEHCPRIAVTVEHVGPHETYQFKGSFAGSRALQPRDLERSRACAERAARAVLALEQRFHFDEEQLRRYMGAPALAVAVAVEEIFLQTPGPGAGRRLVPPAGS